MDKIEVGDEIHSFALPGDGRGKIINILDMPADDGGILCEVIDSEGNLHRMTNTLFDGDKQHEDNNLTEKETLLEDRETDYMFMRDSTLEPTKKQIEIERAINIIIDSLELVESDNVMTKLRNACLLQQYIAENYTYQSEIMAEKETYSEEKIIEEELYNGLINTMLMV